jgi:hypothetical protein
MSEKVRRREEGEGGRRRRREREKEGEGGRKESLYLELPLGLVPPHRG